jgi:hypothetical protein
LRIKKQETHLILHEHDDDDDDYDYDYDDDDYDLYCHRVTTQSQLINIIIIIIIIMTETFIPLNIMSLKLWSYKKGSDMILFCINDRYSVRVILTQL